MNAPHELVPHHPVMHKPKNASRSVSCPEDSARVMPRVDDSIALLLPKYLGTES